VRGAARQGIPIIGVNQGGLGFLTTFSADEARSQFASLLTGDYRIAERALLDCKTGPRHRDIALNDVLIKNATNSRLVRLEVFANGKLVTDYYCDGVIFSTPTGSTAYNLAAGGPIIHPGAGVIAMTPICPHTLSNRTIIFRDDVRLSVYNRSDDSRLLVAMDGQRDLVMSEGSPIEITVSPLTLSLVQRRDYSHFEVMRAKLKWSGGFLDKK
jgi:NAD+ kinase